MKIYTVIFLLVCTIQSQTLACSAFLLQGDNYRVIGFNENWKHMPGMVMVNKRGIRKNNLSWAHLVAAHPEESRMHWTSQYGSVTFNAFGIDLPCYGMNEAGLFMVELFLDKTYSRDEPGKVHMFWAQWIQYQLDTHATVQEVIQHLEDDPIIDWWPTFSGSHFFVADAQGHTAAIEFIKGRAVVSSGKRMPQPILCNGPYQEELANLKQYQDFGGDQPLGKATWELRFAWIAHRLQTYRPDTAKPLDFAWTLLDEAFQGTWQLVADVRTRTLYFRSQACNRIKSISLKDCDFGLSSPVQFIDLHIDFQGDVASQLAAWSPEVNRAYTLAGFPVGYENEAFYRSEDYKHLQANLLHYAEDLQGQIGLPADQTAPTAGATATPKSRP